jgi:uncharacterized repeat protein (TIGR03803 family)
MLKSGDPMKNRIGRAALFPGLALSASLLASADTTVYTLTGLHSFAVVNDNSQSNADGAYPLSGLIQGGDGALYGTTAYGGTIGYGTVFRISPSGAFSQLHVFQVGDGGYPYAPLMLGRDGNFYGTTAVGGTGGSGTIYRLSPGGQLTTLHSFCQQSGCADGGEPSAGLVQGPDGTLYGTTEFDGPGNAGTVYKLTLSGVYSMLRGLNPQTDGVYPHAGLVFGGDGNLYGTATSGGANGQGTIFRVSPAGAFTVLHAFNQADGSQPYGTLIKGADGNLYGTTAFGGFQGTGTIFRISPAGAFSVLHSFNPNPDGAYPTAGLVQGRDGKFYGITENGGAAGGGTIFQISPQGVYTVLLALQPQKSKTAAQGVASIRLLQAADGSFYGVREFDGANSSGLVFRLAVATPPPPPPSLTLIMAPDPIYFGNSATIRWTTSNATSCLAGGQWSGARAVSGSEIISGKDPGSYAYALTCKGPGGSVQRSINLSVLKAATQLSVHPLIASLLPGIGLNLDFSADLVNISIKPAAGIAGRSVVFTAGTTRCTAMTDAAGHAQCSAALAATLAGILNLGYSGAFAGDQDYLPSSGSGSLVTLGGAP